MIAVIKAVINNPFLLLILKKFLLISVLEGVIGTSFSHPLIYMNP